MQMELDSFNIDYYKQLEKDLIKEQKKIKKVRMYTIILIISITAVLIIDNYIVRIFNPSRNELLIKLLGAGLFYSLIKTGLLYNKLIQVKRSMHKILLQHPHLSRMV